MTALSGQAQCEEGDNVTLITMEYLRIRRGSRRPLDDFGVSIFPFGLVLESEDRSQEAENVSGPRDMQRKGIFVAEKITYNAVFVCRTAQVFDVVENHIRGLAFEQPVLAASDGRYVRRDAGIHDDVIFAVVLPHRQAP